MPSADEAPETVEAGDRDQREQQEEPEARHEQQDDRQDARPRARERERVRTVGPLAACEVLCHTPRTIVSRDLRPQRASGTAGGARTRRAASGATRAG